jgi:hypothetical protein
MLYGLSDDDLKNILQAFDLQQWEAGQQGDIFVRYLWMARFVYHAVDFPELVLAVVSTDQWTKAISYNLKLKTHLPAVELRNWHDPVMEFVNKEVETDSFDGLRDGHSLTIVIKAFEYKRYIVLDNPIAGTALQFEDAVYQVEKQLYIEQLLQLGLERAFRNRFLPDEKQQILERFGLEALHAGENNGLKVEYFWVLRETLNNGLMSAVIVVKTDQWLKLLAYDGQGIIAGAICSYCEGKGDVAGVTCSKCWGRGWPRYLPEAVELNDWSDPVVDLILAQDENPSTMSQEVDNHLGRIFREAILITPELIKPLIDYVNEGRPPSIIGEALKPALKAAGRRIHVGYFESYQPEIIQKFQLEQLKAGQQGSHFVEYIWIVRQYKNSLSTWDEGRYELSSSPVYAVLKSDQGFKATRLDKDGVVDLANWDDQVITTYETSDITYFSSNWSSGNLPGYGYVLTVISSAGTHTVAFFNPTSPDLNRLERAIIKAMDTINDLLG